MFLGVCLGAAVGTLLGLTGAGGGVLAVPALMLGLGMSMPEATPVALIAVGAASLIGGLAGLRRGLVRYKAALLMACLGAASAPAGVWLAQRLPAAALVIVFCTVMVVVAWRMLQQALGDEGDRAGAGRPARNCMLDAATGKFRWNLRCSATLAGIGSAAGLFTGMLGVGGGFLIVPAFRQFSDLTMQASSATSLAVIALVSLATVAGLLAGGTRIAPLGWVFVAATGAGLLAGRGLAARLPVRWLQALFALAVLLVAALWLTQTLV